MRAIPLFFFQSVSVKNDNFGSKQINMLRILSILSCFVLLSVIYSCSNKTEIVDPQPVSVFRVDKTLILDLEKRAYYNNGNRFHQFEFVSDTNQRVYEVKLIKSVFYRAFLQGSPMEAISFYLADKEGKELVKGVQGNIGNTTSFFTYTADVNMTAYIVVKNNGGTDNHNKPFYLIFEEAGTQIIEWANKSWLADGDWEVLSENLITHKNHTSGIHRWLRLLDEIPSDYNASIHIQQEGGFQTSLCGMSVKSTSNIFQMLNVPETGKMFLISGPQWWELWYINMGNGGGIGRDFGDTPSPLLTGTEKWNSIRMDSRPDSVYMYINNLKTHSVLNTTYSNNLYIMINDSDTCRLFFKDFYLGDKK